MKSVWVKKMVRVVAVLSISCYTTVIAALSLVFLPFVRNLGQLSGLCANIIEPRVNRRDPAANKNG